MQQTYIGCTDTGIWIGPLGYIMLGVLPVYNWDAHKEMDSNVQAANNWDAFDQHANTIILTLT